MIQVVLVTAADMAIIIITIVTVTRAVTVTRTAAAALPERGRVPASATDNAMLLHHNHKSLSYAIQNPFQSVQRF